MNSRLWPIIFLNLAVAAAVFPLFQGKFYAAGDTRDIFIPLETFFHQEQLKLRLPAWDPDISWSFPVIASAQIGFFYPPLLLTRWLPIWIYLPLNLAAHLIAIALGTYFFLKKLGRSDSAAYLGAISFTLGAFIFQHLTHLNIIFAIAWFPLQLITANKLSGINFGDLVRGTGIDNASLAKQDEQRRKIRSHNFILLSLTLAIPFLAGQIQVPLLMAIVASAYYIYSSLDKGRLEGILLKLAAITLLAICLAAAQLFPTAELAWLSTRGHDSDFDIERANQYSWPPYHLPTLLFPRFFGNDTTYWGHKLEVEQGFFIGTIPLLLSLIALFTPSRLPAEALAKVGEGEKQRGFFRWLTIISFLLALGSLSPFRLIGIESSLWFFSGPARWLLFTTFGLSMLAAHGWDRLFPPPGWNLLTPRGWRWVSGGILTLVFFTNLALFLIPNSQFQNLFHKITQEEYYLTKLNSLLTSLRTSSVSLASPYTYIPLILLISFPFALKSSRGKTILLVGTTVELILVAATANPSMPWKEILTPPSSRDLLPQNVITKQARIFSRRSFEDTGALLTNPENRPADTIHNEPRRLLLPTIHAQFGIPGVAWPASLDLSEQARALQTLRESLDRGEAKTAEELNIGAILSPSLHPGGVKEGYSSGVDLQVLQPKPRASLLMPDGTELAADYKEISPTEIQVTTNSPETATLLVRDTFFPGWKAFVDQREIPIAADGIFRATSVPAGMHTITMHYKPTLLYVGITISLVSLCFLLLFVSQKRVN